MLTVTPVPISQSDAKLIAEWLAHPGRNLFERFVKTAQAVSVIAAADISLMSPLDILANGPRPTTAREMEISAARLQIVLNVLKEMTESEEPFQLGKFDIE